MTQEYVTTNIPPLSKEACMKAIDTERENYGRNEQLLSTRKYLNADSTYPGLDPAYVDDIKIVKEDPGLADPFVTRDYPSPKEDMLRYGGADISFLEEIRIKWKLKNTKWSIKEDSANKQVLTFFHLYGTMVRTCQAHYPNPHLYFVELQPDESNVLYNESSIKSQEENSLAQTLDVGLTDY